MKSSNYSLKDHYSNDIYKTTPFGCKFEPALRLKQRFLLTQFKVHEFEYLSSVSAVQLAYN